MGIKMSEKSGSELAAQFVGLEHMKDDVMEKLQEVIQTMYGSDAKATLKIEGKGAGVEHQLRVQWAKENIDQVKVSGRTVYIRSEVIGFAAGGDKNRMFEAFQDAGYGDLVVIRKDVNFNTMRGFLKEFKIDEDGLPVLPTPELEQAIETQKRISVQTRKA